MAPALPLRSSSRSAAFRAESELTAPAFDPLGQSRQMSIPVGPLVQLKVEPSQQTKVLLPVVGVSVSSNQKAGIQTVVKEQPG
jgi:hypothetical protein